MQDEILAEKQAPHPVSPHPPWAAEIAFADGTTLRLASALAGSLYAKAGSQEKTRQ